MNIWPPRVFYNSQIVTINFWAETLRQLPQEVYTTMTKVIESSLSVPCCKLESDVLKGQANSINVKVSTPKERMLFRWLGANSALMRRREVEAVMLAAKNNIGPQLITYDASLYQYMLLQYIDGHNPTTITTKYLQQVGAKLRKLHSSFHFTNDSITNELKLAPTDNLSDSTLLTNHILTVWQKYHQLEPPAFVLCHNDLHAKNIIQTDQNVYFIDWEDAAFGDGLYDAAYFAVSHNLDSRQEKLFLVTYMEGSITASDEIRFRLLKAIALYNIGVTLLSKNCSYIKNNHVSFGDMVNLFLTRPNLSVQDLGNLGVCALEEFENLYKSLE